MVDDRLRHDLRAPLSVIVGFAELLAADKTLPDERRREYAIELLSAALELRALIDSDRLDAT